MAASVGQYHQTWKESWKPQKCGFTEEHISWKDHVTNDEVLRRGRTEEIDEQNQSGANEFLGTYHEKAWT